MAKTCPSCGTQNRDLARFCQNCRQPLDLVCPACGTLNTNKANFCTTCGYQFPAGSQPLPINAPSTPLSQQTGLLPGTIIDNRYQIEKRLGGGGMGSVYLVMDQRLGKHWAVKEMSDAAITDAVERQQAVQAFENEARLLANLDHPNLPKVNNHFQEGGKYYLVMDLIDGETLDAVIERKLNNAQPGRPAEPFTEQQVLKWAEEICDLLTYLHNQIPPIIFRDLKPGNIMIEKSGRLRLIDFGIARLFKPGKSKDTASFGTKGFAPPEQYGKGQTDARSDVYALGATMHFLLTLRDPGDDPFHFQNISDLNRNVSKRTSDAVAKAVNFERGDRWGTAAEFASALRGSSIPAAGLGAQIPVGSAGVRVAPLSSPVSAAPAVAAAPVARPIVPPSSPTSATASPAGANLAGLRGVTAPAAAPGTPVQVKPKGVRRSSFWGFLLWVAICALMTYGIAAALFHEGVYSYYYSSYLGGFPGALIATALLTFPQVFALLRTRWPGAFSLPLLLMALLLDRGTPVDMIFVGSITGEVIFLFQSFNPKSFWRLFFGAAVAHLVIALSTSHSSNTLEFLLGAVTGVAIACIIGRILSKALNWDS